jgi:heme-degrading monooxygenase HmoA
MNGRVQWSEVLVSEPVTMINAFSVPVAESDRFLDRWKSSLQAMAGRPGFVRARTYRSLVDDVELRFINVAEWESGEALARARVNPEWLAAVQRILDDPELHITPRPSVYEVAIDTRRSGAEDRVE